MVVQPLDFGVASEYAWLRDAAPAAGAIVVFTGLVRDLDGCDPVSGMYLEHYPGMTERSIVDILEEAERRWSVLACSVLHRVGELLPSEQIVFAGVASSHRAAAFEACEFIMDYLKTRAPFWKKEHRPDGDRWVDAKATDQQRADRWR